MSDKSPMVKCALSNVGRGDRVVVDHVIHAEVVFSSEADSYADDFPKSEWPPESYAGLMVREDNGAGLTFFPVDSFIGDQPTSLEMDLSKPFQR